MRLYCNLGTDWEGAVFNITIRFSKDFPLKVCHSRISNPKRLRLVTQPHFVTLSFSRHSANLHLLSGIRTCTQMVIPLRYVSQPSITTYLIHYNDLFARLKYRKYLPEHSKRRRMEPWDERKTDSFGHSGTLYRPQPTKSCQPRQWTHVYEKESRI